MLFTFFLFVLQLPKNNIVCLIVCFFVTLQLIYKLNNPCSTFLMLWDRCITLVIEITDPIISDIIHADISIIFIQRQPVCLSDFIFWLRKEWLSKVWAELEVVGYGNFLCLPCRAMFFSWNILADWVAASALSDRSSSLWGKWFLYNQ